MISAKTRKRIQVISIGGRLAERYFAVTSEMPRNIVEARISAMPLNGRSARAGAFRAADFFSGIGNGSAVQPGGCGDRRIHGNLEGSNFDSGEALQNAKSAESTRHASGMPICAIAPLQHFVKNRVPFGEPLVRNSADYSIGRPRGFGPRGNALSSAAISPSPSTRSPAAAFSAACSAVDAFGIGNTLGARARKLSAT